MRGLLTWTTALIAAGAFSPPAESGRDSIVQRTLRNVLPTLGVQAKKLAVPKTTFNYFENLPVNLHYFNDSKTVLYLDGINGVVCISEDEGKSWSVVDDIPNGKASHFIPHPFNDRMAFVLTRKTTHYITEDRGRTWRSFVVSSEPGGGGMAPLTFHADAEKGGYILYDGFLCDFPYDLNCYYQTLYTKDAFATEPKVLLSHTSHCIFAHSSREFSPDVHSDLIYCTSYESNVDSPHPGGPRLIASSDFFVDDRHMVDYGGETKDEVTAIQVMSKFMSIVVRTMGHDWTADFTLYVTSDCKNWYKARFPHNSNGFYYSYAFLGKGDRSLVVDVQSRQSRRLGTLFISNSNGTDFVETLRDTHRSNQGYGYADFKNIAGIQGGGVMNYVKNARDLDNGDWENPLELRTLISYDDGSSWNALKAPERDMHNNTYVCHANTNDTEICSLHLHLFTQGSVAVEARNSRGRIASPLQLAAEVDLARSRQYRPCGRLPQNLAPCEVEVDITSTAFYPTLPQPPSTATLFTQGATIPMTPPTPPGFIMAAGSVSKNLLDYDLSDMYLSRDAGATWKQVRHGAHKYAFGDQGNIIVLVDDEKSTDHVRYSIDSGETWQKLDLGINLRAMSLTTAPTVTSHSLLLTGGLSRGDQKGRNRTAVIHLDFAHMQTRQCEDDDVEKWYAQGANKTDCIMGHKQWFWRKKAEANCYMGDKYKHPESDAEDCLCTDADYGCDYNYALEGNECVLIGSEPIPAGACFGDDPNMTYQGASGYRLLAGNTCTREGGVRKDKPITKNCTETLPDEGEVAHQTFTFPSDLLARHYFGHGKSILVRLRDRTVWQSSDEGYTWREVVPGKRFLSIWIHPYANERAYLLTDTEYNYATTDGGHSWNKATPPLQQPSYRSGRLSFHPTQPDYLIWTGDANCNAYDRGERNCHVESYLSLDHGQNWRLIETYVEQCIFAEVFTFKADDNGILCSGYHDKTGHQHGPHPGHVLELVIGQNWYEDKKTLFDHIIGFGAFGDYLIVAAVASDTYALDLQISLTGKEFVPAKLPQGIRLRKRDFTKVLQSTPDAIFLQESISGEYGTEWGTLLKSNANGTYYGVSLERVNGNWDHEIAYYRMPGVDGVARVNILTNPDEAVYTGKKKLQTRITHNDGGSWQALKPPSRDSNGALYLCDDETKCALHLHGPKREAALRNIQSESSATGLMLAVGNVGEFLAPRTESDMFLTRNAGITWEEVHKDAHIWAFGDSGAILVIANQEQSTDHVQYTTDHGLHWKEYNFGIKLWVDSLASDPGGSSRKFMLTGWDSEAPRGRGPRTTTIIYLNLAGLTLRQCVLDVSDPARSDFELWKPSEDFGQCLLGSKAHYRKKRSANCYIGDLDIPPATVHEHCECTAADFECEFNHARNSAGECVLIPGAASLASENTCVGDDEFWYERTAYRKISKSLCITGTRLDQGTAHHCHGHWFKSFVSRFWWTFVVLPVGIIALAAVWFYRRRGAKRGAIRLPDGDEALESPSPLRARLASIPSYVAEGMEKFWNYLRSFPGISMSLFGSRRRPQEVALEDDT